MVIALLLALGLLLGGRVLAEPLPEVVVVASALREAPLATVPASITVLDPTTIQRASIQHFEELIPLVPNLNWSGEGSRARYFQIRGTGELEQYEGAPNASVGFVVDDIDFSDLGGIATTFDAGQVEVLRGPQGTRYGANALAGLIFVRTADPESTPRASLTATSGSDGARALGGMATGPVPGAADELSYRVAVQRYEADGFRRNVFLGRDDTSGQDELTARVKLRWQPGERLDAQLTAFHVDLDNGYDDFAIDNGYTTYSDKPGRDAQKTDSDQLSNNLLLSDTATIDAKPQLEIYADDVKCTHGATIGSPPEKIIFYFRSRGIAEDMARAMLTYGFADEVVEEVEVDALKVWLHDFIYKKYSPIA